MRTKLPIQKAINMFEGIQIPTCAGRNLGRLGETVGVRGRAAGTAYFIPARVGVWLVWCGSWGPAGRLGFVAAAARHGGSVFFEVRFRGWGIHGCVLLTEIYKMSHRTYV